MATTSGVLGGVERGQDHAIGLAFGESARTGRDVRMANQVRA